MSLGSILQPFDTLPFCERVYGNALEFHLVPNSLHYQRMREGQDTVNRKNKKTMGNGAPLPHLQLRAGRGKLL